MRNKTQIVLALLLLATALAVGLTLRHKGVAVARPELALPGMEKIRFETATFGTNHVVGTTLGRWVARLPGPVGDFVSDLLGPRASIRRASTATPSLMVWLDTPEPRPPSLANHLSYTAILADEHGFSSGEESSLPYWMPGTLAFQGFPRRSKTLELRIYSHDTNGQAHRAGSLRFHNPRFASYPVWTSEALPATRRVGNLEVTLESFSTGHNNNSTCRPDVRGQTVVEYGLRGEDDPNHSAAHLRLRSLQNTNEIWVVTGVNLFDATGNQVHNTSLSTDGDGRSFSFSPSLWPDEAAWRLRLEIKRKEGFAADELCVFKQVPLGAMGVTNQLALATNFGGVSITLAFVLRRPPRTNDSWSASDSSALRFTHSALPEGLHLDLVGAATDDGSQPVSHGWSASNSERTYYYREIPSEAKTADFTFAVHRSQSVEFMVKPAVAQPPPVSKKDATNKRSP